MVMDAGGRPLVLIIDDEPPVARLITYALRYEGCDVVHAQNVAEARRFLTNTIPSLVVCDVGARGESRLDFPSEIREREDLAEVPVVLMSVYERPRQTRADAFIAKPFDITTFLNVVRPFLGRGAA